MKEIGIGFAIDGDFIKVKENHRIVNYRIVKISNNCNAFCENRRRGKARWINTALDRDIIVAAYRA